MRKPITPKSDVVPSIRPQGQSEREAKPITAPEFEGHSPGTHSTFNHGVCTLVNAQYGTAMDLSAADNKSIIGFPKHDGENQQWRFTPSGGGYTLQSVGSGEYLGLNSEEGISDGTALTMSPFPGTWKVDAIDEENELFVRILWPNGRYALQLASGDASFVHEVQVVSYRSDERRQLWRVTEHYAEEVKTTRWSNSLWSSSLIIGFAFTLLGILGQYILAMRPTTNIYPARTYHKLSLDTGSFNTASFRPWHNPAQGNFGIIHFRAPSTSYDILLGINALDMADSTDLSLKCSLLSFADNSARLNLQSWGNTIQYSSGCSWLSVPADDPDFQSGRYYTIDHQQWSKPQVSTRIVFKRSYPSPPKVVVWLDTIHTDANTNCRAHVYPSDVATDGFTLHLDTWHDTKLHLAGATWVAHSSDRTDIHSGSFCTEDVKTTAHPQLENSARIAFNGANFSSSPRIFMALNKLDIGRQRNLRVSPVHASDVTNTGMTWHLNSWAETELFSAGASFVAYEK